MTLTGREKATIFLSILGADVSSRVLRYLPDELADLIAAGINHLPTPSPEALQEVLSDYQGFLALPAASAPRAGLNPPPARNYPPMTKKNYSFLMYERPQTVAFLLSMLPEEEKGGILSAMPRERLMIEELARNLKRNHLRPMVEESFHQLFAGKVF
ncbi:hypothetical protein A3K48_02745 [candidate division WOR-1 bacterium RIFOXYA12_FULL_52_29]|uniref:Flagellar motor switch protein FliG N-terminal domain-containing protein n=1 Tax=candidate division WOR-1 bacterium RIFOXYC12_FULL_54_18 TaxID=1802584 RepID=A0A1F4T527_UNCSA|nr:MAG: hypothetical protein A3K44_02745 [candidate division WOR-1 bacterium RIFOXYA2_FULL_51_19]OGC17488.1 MAG: hypothetical protein A3K48_02745 [candidate division WOR-1 bacterium RIFOXYA12_FULL_52_29]OGC26346.1 MAG: hypothetical protein A3K32_02740 [candidate division WOR-1 bacterium RIFOXYB2_FULL_45_9]OGC27905.1 MAG: hypothetical protein A3K49_02745 [candidate division WOR-1 bacterium RIFOXYC12_FULL_54_18]OGC29807.1 MAG: hypothetical protein A2346_03590 [candidate division WOR-1 bacterium R